MKRSCGRKGSYNLNPAVISCSDRSNTNVIHLDTISTIDQIPRMCPTCQIKKQFIIEGHRGFGVGPEENTLPAFQKAIDLGLDSIELDVWLSKDDVLVVLHDLVKGEDESARPPEFTVSELQAKGYSTLRQVLEFSKDNILVNIELKPTDMRVKTKVTQLVEDLDMMNQVAYSTFEHDTFDSTPYPTEYGYLLSDDDPYVINLEIPDSLNLQFELISRELVEKIHSVGARSFIWTYRKPGCQYEETEEFYKFLYAIGVDILCTNFPEKAVRFRDSHLP